MTPRNILLGLALLTAAAPLYGEPPGMDKLDVFGGELHDYIFDMCETSAGGYALAGYSSSFSIDESADAWLVCTDSTGIQTWSQTYDAGGEDCIYSIVRTADGGFALTGTSRIDWEDSDCLLIRVDSAGNELWTKKYGGEADDSGASILTTADQGFVIGGVTESYGSEGEDGWVVKVDSLGTEIWNHIFGSSYGDAISGIIETSDSGFVAIGRSDTIGTGNSDAWLLKIDKDGNESWSSLFGGNGNDEGASILSGKKGGFIFGGMYRSTVSELSDFWLVGTDSCGVEEWSRTFGGTSIDDCLDLVATYDGGYALGGRTGSFGAGSYDFWLVRTDTLGNETWNGTFGGGNSDFCRSLLWTRKGGYSLAGYSTSFGLGGNDGILVQTKTEPAIAFSLTSPVIGDTLESSPVFFDWEDTALSDSILYNLLIDDDSTFVSPIIKDSITASEYLFSDSLHIMDDHYWSVTALGLETGLRIRSEETGRFFCHFNYLEWSIEETTASDGNILLEGIDDDDFVFIRFDKPTTKPEITSSNIDEIFRLSGDHTWLDGFSNLGSVIWNEEGSELIINLTTFLGAPTIAVQDTIFPDHFSMSDSSVILGGSFYTVGHAINTPAPLPEQVTLGPARPNPFNPVALIEFALPMESHVKLSVYDLSGRLAAVLADDFFPAGFHSARWNASACASGVYLCRLETTLPVRVHTQKLLLLK